MMSAFVERAMSIVGAIRAADYRALRANLEAREASLSSCAELRAHLEAREAVTRQLAAALKRICKSIPTDTDMSEAGWDGSEIEEACSAYDVARAALQAYDEVSK